MKRIITIVVVFLSITACHKHKTIPDRKLPSLVRDLIVANAYSAQNVSGISSDTVDIYTPILARYGYTDADLRFTLNRMASKKSSRFSEIVDSAIADITRENNFHKWRKSVRDKIDSIAMAKYIDTVYAMDTASIRITSLTKKDSDKKYAIRIPVEQEGEYELELKYKIDTADKRNFYTLRHYFIASNGTERRPGTLSYSRSAPGVKRTMSTSIRPIRADDTLVINLVNYNKNFRKPIKLTIDSIYIVYYPPIEGLRKKLAEEMTYTFFKTSREDETPQKDSGTLYIMPPLRPDTTRRADTLR